MKEYRDKHKGESMIVVGCGPSVVNVPRHLPLPSIGVNHCWEWVETQYLLVLGDPDAHYTPGNRFAITRSTPQAFFMSNGAANAWGGTVWTTNCPIVKIRYRFPWGKPIRKGELHAIPETSPGTALGLALYMGAARVGVVGVDLTTHPNLAKNIDTINERMNLMNEVAAAYGSRIYNLSPRSALDCYPFIAYDEFLDGSEHRSEDAGLLPETRVGRSQG